MQEAHNLEFKREWKDDPLKWISAFANAQGGTLIIGMDDEGQVVGVPQVAKLLEDIPNKVRDVLGIVVEVNLVPRQGYDTLEIWVPAFAYPVSYKGSYHLRAGSTKQELKGAALDHFLLKKQGLRWDAVPVQALALCDLHEPSIARFKRMAVHNSRLEESALQDSNEILLDKLLLLDNGQLKRAAVLLFYPEPERFVSNAFIKIGFFADDHANLRYHDEVHGNLFDQVFNAIEILKLKYLKATISYDGIVRQERFPVPLEALREAVLNAVVHKDYASAAPIQISVYPDKIMIWNPGELPDNWTLDTLLGKHSSRPFNPDIANAFFRSGLIEAWGRGIERIVKACEDNGNPAPEWRVSGGDFWAIFHFSCPNDMVEIGTGSASRPESRPESELAANILKLLELADLSKAELAQKLGHKTVSGELNKQVRALLQKGLIEMTRPDKPTSRLQRYRLTVSGQESLTGITP